MPTLLSLPIEILEAIASNLSSQRDLNALFRTHRRFYTSLTYYLYRYNKEHFGGSAVLWGARKGLIKTVQHSIQATFNLDIKPKLIKGREHTYESDSLLTPLHLAILNSNYAMVKLLIENGSKIDRTDIATTCAESCKKFIWERGRDLDTIGPKSKAFRAAAQMGHKELVDLVSRENDVDIHGLFSPVWPWLVAAVRICEANISIIQLLLDKEEDERDIADDGGYFISRCLNKAQNGCCDMTLKLLLERKSFAEFRHSVSSYRLLISSDAASIAALYGNKPMLNILLEMGAGLNWVDNSDRTPIMWAAHSGQLEVVKLLLEKGANANFKHHFRPEDTALSLARNVDICDHEGRLYWYQDIEEKGKVVEYLLNESQK